jgi:hypothetical protein
MAKRRPKPDAAPSDSESDEPRKKKKKRKKKQEHDPSKPASATLQELQPRIWTDKDLTPFNRVLWAGHPVDEEAHKLRDALGLKVPDVRRAECKFWREGRCERGEACSFAHGAVEPAERARRCPAPLRGLAEPALPRCIGRAMLHIGHREPSPIQAQAWPAILAGHDLICRAPTGSGKTLAYLLPAMSHAMAASPPLRCGQGPLALVLVPTRELAQQVLSTCHALRRPCGVAASAIFGGEPREEQALAMEGVVPLVVATTGRMLDMLISRDVAVGLNRRVTAVQPPCNRCVNTVEPRCSHHLPSMAGGSRLAPRARRGGPDALARLLRPGGIDRLAAAARPAGL